MIDRAEAPVVSVCMITYNHAAFIAQAIDSVLMQKTSFPIELVIGEDESTDGTRDLCKDFARRYPDIINLQLRSRADSARQAFDVPFLHNVVETLAACRGQYVALLEGDDYWTDPEKLQKQVDFLEAHWECSGVYSNAAIMDEHTGEIAVSIFPSARYERAQKNVCAERTSLRDVVWVNRMPTATVLYRRSAIRDLPVWFKQLPLGDWGLAVLAAGSGELAYLDEIMAVYRAHGGGIWSRQSWRAKLGAEMRQVHVYQEHLSQTVQDVVDRRQADILLRASNHLGRELADAILAEPDSEPDLLYQKLTADLSEFSFDRRLVLRGAIETAIHRFVDQGDLRHARRLLIRLLQCAPRWLLESGSPGVVVRLLFPLRPAM